ncbi:MAG: transcription termination factor NusA [Planctomycetota bacterium]|jgi:N utilization substance protein A|nr:transcription termination factor NusA [Planctomycetota bacterium]MDP6762391.1 transcription termination factor NusA [Planctomycetota bacterium]MDP6988836.1 transcription termination factor NusA [Planctomycetota bacterium]
MNQEDLLRMIDVIHREKDIPKERIFLGLEDALAAGIRRRLGAGEDLVVTIDRQSGEVKMEDEEEEYEFDLAVLGRIVAQAVKQGFLQRVREEERDVLYEEYEARVGQLVNGVVQRFEGDYVIVNLGRVEAQLGKEDRVRGETYTPGDRIRALLVEVRKEGSRVRLLISRTHPDLVRRLFDLEVPEIADGIIDIRRVVREPGYRTKMAVISQDPKIDCIGACVGVRGSRIKAVIDELRGERIDIIRWSDSLETLIMNGLKPAVIHLDNIFPDIDHHRAIVIVDEDQQSLAIGKKGQNVRLASKLCGWEIDLQTRAEFEADGSEASGDGAEADPEAQPGVEDADQAPPALEEAPPAAAEVPPADAESAPGEAAEAAPDASEQEPAPSELAPSDEPVSPPEAPVEP